MLLDDEDSVAVDKTLTASPGGQWMLLALGADGYRALTKPTKYECYSTLNTDGDVEISPTQYETFVARVLEYSNTAQQAAASAKTNAETAATAATRAVNAKGQAETAARTATAGAENSENSAARAEAAAHRAELAAPETGKVVSVNGKGGVVILTAQDLGAVPQDSDQVVKSLTLAGKTLTVELGDGSKRTFTTQDTTSLTAMTGVLRPEHGGTGKETPLTAEDVGAVEAGSGVYLKALTVQGNTMTVTKGDGSTETVTLQRERISIPGVPYTGWVADGIGYIRHSDFTEGCYEDMRAAVEKLRTGGELKGLILDYRSNGGGIMQEAIKILGMFVPKGTEVVSTKGRTEDSRQVYRTSSEPILPDLPLAVLINGNSASASEIVTGALQDLDRAVVIGQRSYGKGLVQSPRPLGYNAMLKLTTAKYYIPSGRCIQAIDYSHSQEGSVKAIPDSLITEYRTRAGRKVYDGGGIMPDIRTEPEYISRFAMTLYALGFVEDFGDDYMRRHPDQRIDIRNFSITDRDYADFAEFMKDKKVPYESDTRRALKALKKAAEDDRFADLKEKFDRVEAELKDDTQTNLETYRKEIVETINNDIVMRHGYSEGVIEHSLKDDPEVLRATEILGDGAEYTRIVTEQDTPRK